MSTSAAKSYAMAARSATNTNDKLDKLAQAIYELARSLDDIETRVQRLPTG